MGHAQIRPITREEAEHFRDRGWVKLPRLIAPDFALRLRDRADRLISGHAQDRKYGWWIDHYDVTDEDQEFAAFGLSGDMGLNAQRLMRRSAGIRVYSNSIAVKAGSSQRSTSGPSPWHQDGSDVPVDRSSWVRLWVALDQVTPDMGPINFIDRSHQLGLLGDTHIGEPDPNRALFEAYPDLAELREAGPLSFEPGDATAHGLYTVHGAPGNDTALPRWTFMITYMADDVRYTASTHKGYGFEKARRAGLAPAGLFDSPLYPRICEAQLTWTRP